MVDFTKRSCLLFSVVMAISSSALGVLGDDIKINPSVQWTKLWAIRAELNKAEWQGKELLNRACALARDGMISSENTFKGARELWLQLLEKNKNNPLIQRDVFEAAMVAASKALSFSLRVPQGVPKEFYTQVFGSYYAKDTPVCSHVSLVQAGAVDLYRGLLGCPFVKANKDIQEKLVKGAMEAAEKCLSDGVCEETRCSGRKVFSVLLDAIGNDHPKLKESIFKKVIELNSGWGDVLAWDLFIQASKEREFEKDVSQ